MPGCHAVWLSVVGFVNMTQQGIEMPEIVSKLVTDRTESEQKFFVKMRVNRRHHAAGVDLPPLTHRQLVLVGCDFLGVRVAVGKRIRMLDLHFGN